MSVGPLEGFGELGSMIRRSCLTPRGSRCVLGAGSSAGSSGESGGLRFVLHSGRTSVSPPVAQDSWTIPERTSLCFPSRWKAAHAAPVNGKPVMAAQGWNRPSDPAGGIPKRPPGSPRFGVPALWSRGWLLPLPRSSAHLGWGRQAAPSSAPQEARSEGSRHRAAASASARNKRLKILGSASRGEEPGAQSAIKDELWVN